MVLGLVLGLASVAGFFIAGVRYLRRDRADAATRWVPHFWIAMSGIPFLFVAAGGPWFLGPIGFFICPDGHETLARTTSLVCAGAQGAFVIGDYTMMLAVALLFVMMACAYLLLLWLARTLLKSAGSYAALGGAGAAVTLLLAALIMFPRIVLPVATPVNRIVNRDGVPSYRLMETPLVSWAASDEVDADAFARLLAKSTPIDVRGRDNRTALIAAARHGDAEKVRILLDHGADPSPVDADGMTALDYASAQLAGGKVAFAPLVERLRAAMAADR